MIIDDSEADRYLSEVIVSTMDPTLNIIFAEDGFEALEVLKASGETPDLILLDINMPRMNGHEFLEAYSENSARDIPVVVMLTSSDQERDKEQAVSYGCVKDYFVKPIDKDRLRALLESLG